MESLDGFELASEGDKLAVLRSIKEAMGTGGLPGPFLLYRVLPSLLHSISLPTAPSGAMLPLVLDLGKLVPPSEYGKMVLDPVIKLYASTDRGTRMALLDGLGEYADKLDTRIVSDRIWPHLVRQSTLYLSRKEHKLIRKDHWVCRYSSGNQRSNRQSHLPNIFKGASPFSFLHHSASY